MDDVAAFNQARWDALARANTLFTRPVLHLDAASARARIDPDGWLGTLDGLRVLCLASGGGGQQAAAFALLGSLVTVADLSVAQLARDRQAAAHYGLTVTAQSGRVAGHEESRRCTLSERRLRESDEMGCPEGLNGR